MKWMSKVANAFGYLCCLICLALCLPSAAEEQPRYQFDFSAQPLAKALANYARVVQHMVVFDPRALKQLQAPPLRGEFTAGAALEHLLATSQFMAVQTAQGWLIKPKPAEVTAPFEPTVTRPPPSPVEDTLVLGRYGASLGSALEKKRAADQLVDVVVAEDIGKFPAHNIAEALQRAPGISVVRDRGEALFVSIRGLPTNFNNVTLNGHNLASNENVRNSEQYGRRFHYDTFPAELVAGVDVIKSTSAVNDEGAIGGSVNIRTFKPFALGKPSLSFQAAASYPELAQETDPRLFGLASWINDDKTFGVLLASAYTERSLRQDRALNFRWFDAIDGVDTDGDGTLDTGPVTFPGSVRPTLEFESRQRWGLTSTIEWRPTDEFALAVNLVNLRQTIDYQEYSYSADYELPGLLPGSIQLREGALVTGETRQGSVQISRESAGLVDRNRALDIAADWQQDDWTIKTSAAVSLASSFNDDPIRRTRLRRLDDVAFYFSYPRIGSHAVPDIAYRNLSLLDETAFPGRRLEWRIIDTEDRELAVDSSAERQLHNGYLTSLIVGAKWRQRQRDYLRRDAIITDNMEGEYFPADYFLPFPARNFLGESHGNLPQTWLIPHEEKFWQGVSLTMLRDKKLDANDLLNSYRIEEDVRSLYAQLNFAGADNAWRGNLGLRYAGTAQDALGHRLQQQMAAPLALSNDYENWLPSANVAIDLTEDLLWRASAARVISRPDFQDLAPRLTFNSGDINTAAGGNPYLTPVEAWQYDMALEWYLAEQGLLSAAIFYKDLDNFIQTQISQEMIEGQLYELTSKSNGAQAQVQGIELTYQQALHFLPSPWRYFGVHMNYTYTDSLADYLDGERRFEDRLADVARNSVNFTLYYERGHSQLRMNYSWRDDVLSQVGINNLAVQNAAAFGSLDLQASYALNANVSVTLEGINVTGAAEQEYVGQREFSSYTYYGRTFSVGVKWTL